MATKPKKSKGAKSTADNAELELTRTSDIEKTPQGIVKRWAAELELSHQREADWREESKKLWMKYEAEKAAASSFNIFWSNTEILQSAVYNSTPQPDVRRRFRDEDTVGKYVSKILERSLAFEIDDYDFDGVMDDTVLDMLVVGRGLPRIKYEPEFVKVGPDGVTPAPAAGEYIEPPEEKAEGAADAPAEDAAEGDDASSYEKLADQHVPCEHVQWDDYRCGPGKRWNDLPWEAFRHEFTFEMAEKAFGLEIAQALTYTQTEGTERATNDKQVRAVFKVCEVWEIWDKDQRRVLFIAPTYTAGPCRNEPDPLHLKNFWPNPRPAYAVRNSRKTVPTPLYRLYEQQAIELNRISLRISKLQNALKVRGAYYAQLTELASILEADDNDMIPVKNAAAIAENGLDKAIWIMPIDKLQAALQALYVARDQTKQTIYEIIGIADILRGASDPNETAKAQAIKSQWGSIRVQKMQREIQRVARDLMRLKAEVIAEQFTPDQLSKITSVQLPTKEQKDMATQGAAQAKQAGQPLPPDVQKMLALPSWDDVMGVMRSDSMRSYRIDVETDSTVAETINRDMTGLGELLSSLAGWVEQSFAAVQMGAMTVDTLKEIALAVIRRARLGSAVEDAFEQIQAPPPKPDQGAQLEQMKQGLLDLIKTEGTKLTQQEQGIEQRHQEVDAVIQQLGQGAQAASAHAIEAHQTAQTERASANELQGVLQQFSDTVQAMMRTMHNVQASMTAPKQVVFDRGPDKRVNGARVMTQNATPQPTPIEGQLMQALSMLAGSMQRIENAITAPKQISFTRDPKSQRITGATASV
jgi:hypothetical protein